ncbi:GNAT family N-acetyltransferase [Psychromonas algicola]|uniref:GNAT family N-acetyltransferase n=1 Tax=Psychromonas algicola TaxID=2555642 RepID=UPI00106828E4|nr:peptidogalycan biosysnthesis protein [Psychromonas sp. RZ5]TEW49573.1 N-acetyltransferase [Psychromonas sp. RZ5]
MSPNIEINVEFINALDAITSEDWQTLNPSACPFLHYDFFNALEKSQSASIESGWQPHHLLASANDELIAFMPMYLKSHSWGEYVFDWDWAEAFKHYDIPYYPKLVATIPFTPVSSNKLLTKQLHISTLFEPLITHCQQQELSSWHILYCEQIKTPLPEDVYERNTVQFHWFNRDYKSFGDYLNTFTSRKRRNTRKERLTIPQQGIEVRELKGHQISPKDLAFFYLTYQLTYLKRGHQPHLTIKFFEQVIATLSDNVLLLIASDQEEDVACALFFYDDEQLYGRYWGCTKQVNNLHFELCYYRGIEFCIQNNLKSFTPGTQGEHKIQRGFEPILTYSYHWIKHPGFKDAIKDFCQREQAQMRIYQEECRQLLPFKKKD